MHLQQHLQQTKKSPNKQRARTQPGRYRQSPLPNSPLSFRDQRMHIPKVGEKKLKTNIGPKRNSSMLATKNPTKKSSPTAGVFCVIKELHQKIDALQADVNHVKEKQALTQHFFQTSAAAVPASSNVYTHPSAKRDASLPVFGFNFFWSHVRFTRNRRCRS